MSISRAQKIVDLSEEALKEIRNYKKQNIPSWRKVLLEEAESKISSVISDVKEGFAQYLNM